MGLPPEARHERGPDVRCAPVTMTIAVCAVVATALLRDHPELWLGPVQVLVHADGAHLVGDVVAWMAAGLLFEARAGSLRWGLWAACGAGASHLAHSALYPDHAHLLGLSAVVYASALAGACSGLLRGRGAWVVALVLALALADELLRGHSAWRSVLGGAGGGFGGPADVRAVPLVHACAAALGIVLGLAARATPREACAPAECAG
ncbi:MAG: hypothetical protein KF869_00910 [Phycisphaeraceae bacterium]|nr:hypothetical protein [Phycisphaeraceae bacterium]